MEVCASAPSDLRPTEDVLFLEAAETSGGFSLGPGSALLGVYLMPKDNGWKDEKVSWATLRGEEHH